MQSHRKSAPSRARNAAAADPKKEPVNDLIEYIRSKGFRRGDRLPPIRQLAQILGHGANSIRDSVLQAQTMGAVRIEPRLGIFVQNPETVRLSDSLSDSLQSALGGTEQNLFHLLDTRILIEAETTQRCARSKQHQELLRLRTALDQVLASHGGRMDFIEADEAFHLAIAKAAGNPVLVNFLRTLLMLLRPTKILITVSYEKRDQSDREHREIFRRIAEGDAEGAAAAVREHLDHARVSLLEHLRTLPATVAAR